MATIYREIDIDAPLETVWNKVSNTAQISDFIGFVATSTQQGDTRVCKLEGGGELTEKIISVDDELKRVMYSITSSPLNMEFHSASMQLEEIAGATRLKWAVDLLPAEAVNHMAPMLDGACADMKEALAV